MSALEKEVQPLRDALYGLLGPASASELPHLPAPLVELILGYVPSVVHWKLCTKAPGLYGPIVCTSPLFARYTETPVNAMAFVQGDTVLTSGLHAWRVRLDYSTPGEVAAPGISSSCLGVARAGQADDLEAYSLRSAAFYGCDSATARVYLAGGRSYLGSGLDVFRSGDVIDFVLDVERARLTVITLKDGESFAFPEHHLLPSAEGKAKHPGWIPHFFLYHPGTAISVAILDPDDAGKEILNADGESHDAGATRPWCVIQ